MLFDIMSVDVRFVFFDGEFFEVYRIVFVVVFFIFKNVLFGEMFVNYEFFQYIFEDVLWICDGERNCLNFFYIEGKCQGKGRIVIRLYESIIKGIFFEVLFFFYIGLFSVIDDKDKNFIIEIQDVVKKFQLIWLIDICINILLGDFFFLI